MSEIDAIRSRVVLHKGYKDRDHRPSEYYTIGADDWEALNRLLDGSRTTIARLRTTSQGHYDDALAARDEVAALRAIIGRALQDIPETYFWHVVKYLRAALTAAPPIDSGRQEAEHALCEASERLYEGCRVDAENGDALVSVQPRDWAAWVHALDRWADARDDNLRVPSVATGAKEE